MPECIVVGGGVIGLLTARRLHLEGVDVLLLERGPLGGESSWAGGGIISPLYPWRYDDAVNVLAEKSKTIYPQLAQALIDETGSDSELTVSGLYTVTDDPGNALDWAGRWHVHAEPIASHEDVCQIEPLAGDAVTAGVWMPDIMQIRNPRLVKALKASFDHHGIPYREHAEVSEIRIESERARGVVCNGEAIDADTVIIASGAWSGQFTSTTDVQVSPVKGQMIMYKGPPGLLHRMVLSEGHYVIPRRDGRILAGSTLEKRGFDKSISEEALEELHQAAVSLIPALAELEIERQWAGLRPGTEKGIPYVCQHNQIENLYIHAGHFRNGIVLGAGSVELMVDLILGREAWCDSSPYSIDAVH